MKKSKSGIEKGNLPRRTMRLHHTFIALSLIAASRASTAAQDGKLFGPPAPDDQAAQISEYVRKVFQDRDGNFWFGTNGDGVCRYDGKSLKYLSVEQGFGGRAVRGILQDEDSAMWFATDGGVSRYKDGVFTNYTVANGLSDNEVWSMMRDSSGAIWVGTQAGVCRFDGASFVPLPIPRAEVENPVSRFNPNVVWSMVEDQEGNIWFGTDGEGARKYDGKSFTTYTTKNGLAGDNVRCIYADRRGRIWLGTDGYGVSRYDGTSFQHFTAKDGLSNDRVFGVLEDKAGDLWFSTLGAGACRYDGKSFTAYGPSSGLTRTHVQSMFEDKGGTLWFGCSGGLFRFDGKSFVNVTRNGPWPAPPQEPTPAKVANPMASFARMVSDGWQQKAPSGTSTWHMFDTWHWGPGQHSMRVMTDGSDADGEPWRELQVFYWHPGRKQVCLLGLSPFARGVSEGTIKFEGETADAVFDLYQTGHRRKMGLRWAFDGPDKYHEILLEATGPDGLKPMNAWDHVRSKGPPAPRLPTVEEAPKPSKHLKALASLLGHTWEAKGEWATGDAFHIQSTFEWIPYADGIYARTVALTKDGEPSHLLDAYFFHHTGANVLRCLALSNRGGVYVGDLTVLEGGALQLDLKGYEGDRVVAHVVRLDFEQDGTLLHRVWSLDGAERTLMLDVHHKKLEPNKH